MARPLLSIGMIVKNEERCLEKCLKALKSLRDAIPCELVVADTGSTDKTREIAEKYADVVFDFKWINDFAAARNAVMDKCTGEWYLTVDADEYFNSSVDEIVSFLTGPLSRKHNYATITQRNFSSPDMSGDYSDFNALRMVRMDTGLRYEGCIHETFPFVVISSLTILRNTVFDHDGYTALSPKHLKEKSKRNMALLERELKEDPKSIRRVLQCLESVGADVEKKRYYVGYARELLIDAKNKDPNFAISGGPCISTVFKILIEDRHPEAKKFLDWAFENNFDSYYVLLDVRYVYIKYLYEKEEYIECEKYCKDYLKSFRKYENRNMKAVASDLGTPLAYAQQRHKQEIETLLVNVLLESEKYDEAVKYLENIDLTVSDKVSSNNWFSAILNAKNPEKLKEIVGETIGKLLQKYHNNELKTNESYELAIATISKPFSCYEKKEQDHNVFELVPGAIGISVKIADAKTKEEAECYLKQIDVWEEFMPLALGRVIELNAELPKEFYFMDANRLSYLLNDLLRGVNRYSAALLENLLVIKEDVPFYKISFLFNLILTLLFSKEFKNLDDELKLEFVSSIYPIAEIYLSTCYKKELLENEEFASCLPDLHLFSWYLLRANVLKVSNSKDYEKIFKTIVERIPQSKQIVSILSK